MIEPTQDELQQLGALLHKHEIETLVAKHKLPNFQVSFDVQWLDNNSLAASFPRMNGDGPYFITLSPLLLEWGFTDRISLSSIILHELAHVIDRFKNWTKYDSREALNDPELQEFEADDFVIACGWKDGLIEALRLTIVNYREHGIPHGMVSKRLARLSR